MVVTILICDWSTRQLLRLARRLGQYPDESAYNLINKACLGRFLPALARESLDKMLERLGVEKTIQVSTNHNQPSLILTNDQSKVFNFCFIDQS